MRRPPAALVVGGYTIGSGLALIVMWLIDRRRT